MEMVEPYTEEEALRFLERGGRWQWVQLVLVMLTYLSSSHATFVIIFTGFQPKFVCRDLELSLSPDEISRHNHSAEIFDNVCWVKNATSNSSMSCSAGFHYEVHKSESIVSEWDLVCDKAYLSEVSQMLFTVGSAIGAALVAPLSDRVGRRWTFIISRLLTMFISYAIVFVPGITGFMVLRFLGGILITGTAVVRGVYLSELSPLKFRPVITTVSGTSWGACLCIQALIGYLMRGVNWRYFQALISVSFFTVILDIIFIKESLIWLYANGRRKEASAILKAAMKTNGITIDSLVGSRETTVPLKKKDVRNCDKDPTSQSLMSMVQGEKGSYSDEEIEQRRTTVLNMMKNRTSRRLIFVISVVWFVTSLVYYGLSLMSSAMSGDRIFNFFGMGAVEIPACCGLYVLVKHFGRQKTMMICYIVCGVSLLMAGALNITFHGNAKIVAMQVVTFVGKFGISATFIMLYFYTTELLPTNFRTTGLGIGSFFSKTGSCLSPFSSVLLRLLPWGPGVIFGSFCLVVALLFICVPETKNRQLPQSVIEIENWETQKNSVDKKDGSNRPAEIA